jgi:hypothetical protein
VQIGAQYQVSPLMSAFASYSYYDSKNVTIGQTTLINTYLVGLTWRH